MDTLLTMLNNGAVSVFGSVLAASFCNIFHTTKKRRIFWCAMAVILLAQSGVYAVWDAELLRKLYPLVVHLPLVCLLYLLTKGLLWSVISVFTAYLCCQLRRWLALFVVALASGDSLMQEAVELLVTVPILLLLLRLVSPAVRHLAGYPAKRRLHFGIIPALYYIFDYATVVYTDVLTSGSPVVVEFMPLVCCVGYLVFVLYDSALEQKRSQLSQIQNCLDIQLKQSVREIGVLRESQELMRRYRHDLRHHLQYVSACIENGRTEQAKEYISDICQEVEAKKVKQYCENETANLIFSSFEARAEKSGIPMHICGTLPVSLPVAERDLCVLLSNALENAIHACQPLAAAGESCTIEVQFYEKKGRLFLQVDNPCGEEVCFENGVPVSEREGHGIGVQSICAIVERYQGVYSFQKKNGKFVLRLQL